MSLVHFGLLFGLTFLRLLNEDAKRLSQKAAQNEQESCQKKTRVTVRVREKQMVTLYQKNDITNVL